MDFQVHEQTYFLNLAEDENRWEVLVATPTGVRAVSGVRGCTEVRSDCRVTRREAQDAELKRRDPSTAFPFANGDFAQDDRTVQWRQHQKKIITRFSV